MYLKRRFDQFSGALLFRSAEASLGKTLNPTLPVVHSRAVCECGAGVQYQKLMEDAEDFASDGCFRHVY